MSDVFYALVLLACPIGMGAMMWFMMRGGQQVDGAPGIIPDPGPEAREREVEALRQEIADLRTRVANDLPAPAERVTR
ncbi:coiled-coil domain-containing protein [Streptomyces mayteni]